MQIKGGAKWPEFSASALVDADISMTAAPLGAAKKIGLVPDWTLAASGLFTMNDPADDAITDQMLSESIQDPNGTHFLIKSVERASGAIMEVPASKLGEVSGTILDAVPALSFGGGDGKANDTAASTDGSADGIPNFMATTPVGTGSIAGTATPAGAGSVAEPLLKVATVIADGATLELGSAYSGTITFAGDTGTLKINDSASFSGTIAGHLAIGNVIDLANITAGANAEISYSGNNSPGTLTVSDGTHTANIALEGNYSLANFTAYSDGHGGTSIIDPPTYVGTGFDANGWTTFTPSADTHIIYVSSSTGSDSNDGFSANTAVATIDKGLSLIRDGSADWLLLKANDTWVNQEFGYLDFSGRSATQPILISSYGTGARPLIETGPDGSGAAIGGIQANHDNIAIVGLDFYAYTRDPSNPNFAGPGSEQNGMRFISPSNNLLVEDTTFRFYSTNSIEGNSSNVILRRDILADNYDTTANSEGLYVDNVVNLVLEQNLFDHNGWNSSVAGASPNIFSHDLYIQTSSGPATVIGNIFANASSHGAQVRPGGTVIDNLFVRDPIGLLIGGSASTVSSNVFIEGNDIDSSERGWGIDVNPSTGPVQVLNNVVAHEASAGAGGFGISFSSGDVNNIAQNNIIYQWGSTPIIDDGSGDITSPNAINLTGYLDPNRSVETYMASLGDSATLAAFIEAARGQSKSNWNPQYTADAVNSYIEAGFVMTGGGAPPPPGAPFAIQLAVAVEATMYNATGTAAEIISLSVNFLPPQIANATQLGLNAQVYASEALGLVFAFGNETGSSAFANNFGPSNNAMPNTAAGDAAFAAAASGTIFGGASTANLVSVMDTFVTNWKAFYSSHGIPGSATPTADQIDLASRGAAWGDMVGIALVNDIGPLRAQVMNFVNDIAGGTAIYGASLVGQPIHDPFV